MIQYYTETKYVESVRKQKILFTGDIRNRIPFENINPKSFYK